jgi:hypothetical protein
MSKFRDLMWPIHSAFADARAMLDAGTNSVYESARLEAQALA